MPNLQASLNGVTETCYLVFLSHSSQDAWVANAIADKLRQQGCQVWLDTDRFRGGELIHSEVLKAVDSCDEAIILFSPFSIKSRWVIFEMGAIYGQRKRITPILNHVKPEAIPVIPGIKSIDINQIDQLLLPGLAQRIQEKARCRVSV